MDSWLSRLFFTDLGDPSQGPYKEERLVSFHANLADKTAGKFDFLFSSTSEERIFLKAIAACPHDRLAAKAWCDFVLERIDTSNDTGHQQSEVNAVIRWLDCERGDRAAQVRSAIVAEALFNADCYFRNYFGFREFKDSLLRGYGEFRYHGIERVIRGTEVGDVQLAVYEFGRTAVRTFFVRETDRRSGRQLMHMRRDLPYMPPSVLTACRSLLTLAVMTPWFKFRLKDGSSRKRSLLEYVLDMDHFVPFPDQFLDGAYYPFSDDSASGNRRPYATAQDYITTINMFLEDMGVNSRRLGW